MSFFPHISEVVHKVPAPCMFVYSIFWLIWLFSATNKSATQIPSTCYLLINSVGLVKGRSMILSTLPTSLHLFVFHGTTVVICCHLQYESLIFLFLKASTHLCTYCLHYSCSSQHCTCICAVLWSASPASFLTAEREREREGGSERLWSLWSKPAKLHSPARPGSVGAWSSWVETPRG